MTYPYQPPPIDETEPAPIPNNPKTSGIHTSFSILYNWRTGFFEIGNAAFSDDPEGLSRLSQYLKHFTPPPSMRVVPMGTFPDPANHPVTKINPKLPKKIAVLQKSELSDFLDDLIDGLGD